jgi:hypothetical protein
MRYALLSILLCGVAFASEPRPIVEIAHQIATSDMTTSEWEAYTKSIERKYADWLKDEHPSDSFGAYLNTKFLEIAPSARGGDIPALKKVVYFMALYVHFGELPPKFLRDLSREDLQELEYLAADFSWEKLSEKVKENAHRYDEKKKKK